MLLDGIKLPSDLRKLSPRQLPEVCQELRDFIVEIVAKEGGHLSASLGVIELTVSLHYLFNTPEDKLVWDVGHQAYGHKILTGRKDVFNTNRKFHGISGFPKRSESEYDAFGTGHSSTAISAIMGMAEAAKVDGNNERTHIAVVGDGALTGGMAFEALNHAGVSGTNVLIIINDNSISIDENGGALKEHLAALRNGMNKGGNLFEILGFDYSGPIDGHNLDELMAALSEQKKLVKPRILHVVTKKGKGYAPAEEGNAVHWHAPGTFDVHSGKVLKSPGGKNKGIKYQEVFGRTLLNLAEKNKNIVGVTPAMPSGSSMNLMMEKFPERAFDVDIAEQHAVTFSAGLATVGYLPFCNIYSTFLQRGYDQLIHDVALQQLKVIFCIDRAGLVGEDGATHHGVFDLAYLRCIPNLIVSAPMDAQELSNLMHTASLTEVKGPMSIRYPRGYSDADQVPVATNKIEIGTARVLSEGEAVGIISIGTTGLTVTSVLDTLNDSDKSATGHLDLRFLKPMDEVAVIDFIKKHRIIITIEDGCLMGGMGSAILELMQENNLQKKVKMLGIPDQFYEQGSIAELKAACRIDEKALRELLKELLSTA